MGERIPVSIALAGLAMGICALGGIAYYMGWMPWQSPAQVASGEHFEKTAPSNAKPAPHSEVVLLPGESLVAPPDPPTPVPVPAPATSIPPATAAPATAPARKPSTPKYTNPPPHKPAPSLAKRAPAAREPPRPNSYERSTRSVCLNCGVVTGISRGDYDWEVRVRLDDGTRRAFRFYDRPAFDLHDPVHIADGRLLPD